MPTIIVRQVVMINRTELPPNEESADFLHI
jgi:hypothetical protein